MILFAVEAPDDERDTDRRKSAYVTGKEMRVWLLIGGTLLALGYFFLFLPWKSHRDFVIGKNNLNVIRQALNTYAADNSDGLPPTYLLDVKDKAGNPITWANALFDSMKDIGAFTNIANPTEGNTQLLWTKPDKSEKHIELSYGMLSSISAIRKYEMRDETVTIAMTLSSGALQSYNPLPLTGKDGFLIGYDNSNALPNGETTSATRLAFTDGGKDSIHGQYGIAGLRADGSIVILPTASSTKVGKRGNVPFGQWVPN